LAPRSAAEEGRREGRVGEGDIVDVDEWRREYQPSMFNLLQGGRTTSTEPR
jgi:hypothetical protein